MVVLNAPPCLLQFLQLVEIVIAQSEHVRREIHSIYQTRARESLRKLHRRQPCGAPDIENVLRLGTLCIVGWGFGETKGM